MSASSPLVFRPSVTHRTLSALLCAGSWVVGIRGLILLVNNLPRLMASLRQTVAAGESTFLIWIWIGASLALCLVGGLLMVFSTLGLVLIEGTHILVDEIGITVDHAGLPRPLATRLGAGHLPWKHVIRLEKGKIFFILRGGPPPGGSEPHAIPRATSTLKFLLVDELERLILIILERSPNLTFS